MSFFLCIMHATEARKKVFIKQRCSYHLSSIMHPFCIDYNNNNNIIIIIIMHPTGNSNVVIVNCTLVPISYQWY